MESRRPSRVRKLTQKMSDFAKDEEASSLLQLLDGRLGAEPDAIVKEERNLSKVSEAGTSLRRSSGRAAAAHRVYSEDEGEEERSDWDQFQVHPLDRGKAPSQHAAKSKRDQSRAVGDAPLSTSSVDSRQALVDQSIKQHRQVPFPLARTTNGCG